ncbi:MAG: hypothetical protein V3T17_18360, partial [Pseudomonadales bacterium]
ESALKVTAQHDDNINLEVTNQDSVYGETINPSAKLQMKTETWVTSIDTDLRFTDFNRRGYDSDDQYVDLLTRWSGEKSSFSLSGNATHDTTRTSEAEDSGRFSNERRKFYSLASSWSYAITDRNTLAISANLSMADYRDERYTGYDNAQIYTEWTHIYTENVNFFLRANVSEYESDGRTQNFTFVNLSLLNPPAQQFEQTYITKTAGSGFQLGANYLLTEQLTLFGLFGSSENDSKYEVSDEFDLCNLTATESGWIARGACTLEDQSAKTKTIETNVSWKQERQTLTAGYTVQTQPSSNGYVTEAEAVTLNWHYQLSEKNSLNTTARWGENKALEVPDEQLQTNRSNREYNTATVAYSHQLTENWSVSASFHYRYQDRGSDDSAAEATGGRIAITYRPQTKQWSK